MVGGMRLNGIIQDIKSHTEKKGMNLMRNIMHTHLTRNHRSRNTKNFADEFPDGIFAVPRSPQEPRVKIRALYNYCLEKNKQPSDLSESEMEQFLVR